MEGAPLQQFREYRQQFPYPSQELFKLEFLQQFVEDKDDTPYGNLTDVPYMGFVIEWVESSLSEAAKKLEFSPSRCDIPRWDRMRTKRNS